MLCKQHVPVITKIWGSSLNSDSKESGKHLWRRCYWSWILTILKSTLLLHWRFSVPRDSALGGEMRTEYLRDTLRVRLRVTVYLLSMSAGGENCCPEFWRWKGQARLGQCGPAGTTQTQEAIFNPHPLEGSLWVDSYHFPLMEQLIVLQVATDALGWLAVSWSHLSPHF